MTVPISLLAVHFVADFVLQSDWMATQKSRRVDALLAHVGLYSLCFAPWGWRFAALTFVLHLVTDATTSRMTSRLWAANERHWFFVVIGADQLAHFTALAWTIQVLG